MYFVRTKKYYLNLNYMIEAEDLDEDPDGRLRVAMVSGRVRDLEGDDAAIVRRTLKQLLDLPASKAVITEASDQAPPGLSVTVDPPG